MKRFVPFLLLLTAPLAAPLTAAAPPRAYVDALRIDGFTVAELRYESPRMEAAELESALADPQLAATLDAKHLARLGELTVGCTVRLGTVQLATGTYPFGIAVAGDAMELLVYADADADEPRARVALATERGPHVPQLTFAFLAEADVHRCALEARFGAFRGTVALAVTPQDLATGMNDRAYVSLTEGTPTPKTVAEALRLATLANERLTRLAGRELPAILDTLALAQFASGRVEEALATQRRAIAALTPEEQAEFGAILTAQLRRFEAAAEGAGGDGED